MDTLLITGTDTDVGKTVLTTGLGAYWQTYYAPKKLGLMKLIQTGVGTPQSGSLGDGQLYDLLFSTSNCIQCVTPLCFEAPLAPPIAAEKEGKKIELEKVWQAFQDLQRNSDFVIVEALGGLGSPVTDELTVADIAGSWRFKVVLVVPVKLGAIAAVVANVALARQHKIQLQGIVLSCTQPVSKEKLADLTPINLIQNLTQVPVLGTLPYLSNPQDLDQLVSVISDLNLEMFFTI